MNKYDEGYKVISQKSRICFVVSSIQTVKAFLVDQIRALLAEYEVSVVANTDDFFALRKYGIDVSITPIGIERKISLWRDAKALLALVRFFRQNKFSVVHSLTPKAGLLSMLAGCFTGIPSRIHMFTGQVWVTKRGIKRAFLRFMDKVIASCATHILVDSHSQRKFLIENRVVSEPKSAVLGNGSSCGVDGARFRPDSYTRETVRHELGIGPSSIVLLFVGRLNQEKGVLDLAEVFARACQEVPTLHLIMLGSDEEGLRVEMIRICSHNADRIHFLGQIDHPEHYMTSADILVLPSYREGLPMAVLEAAACGVPAVASRVYGLTDAVDEEETGLLFPVRNLDAFYNQLMRLVRDSNLRLVMGKKGRERVLRLFSRLELLEHLRRFYKAVCAVRDAETSL